MSWRAARRGLNAVLQGLESVLLSASGRERIHAIATFALIFLFAVTSIDFLITGGPEFGAPARAERPAVVVQAAPATPAPTPAPVERAEEAIPTEVASSLAEARAANVVVAVSQNFDRPVRRALAAPADRDEAPLGGEQAAETTQHAAVDVARERKRKLSDH